MCITITSMTSSRTALAHGENDVTFTVAYDNTGAQNDELRGTIASSMVGDKYVFLPQNNREHRFAQKLSKGIGTITVNTKIKVTALASEHGQIDFGLTYGINSDTRSCNGKDVGTTY